MVDDDRDESGDATDGEDANEDVVDPPDGANSDRVESDSTMGAEDADATTSARATSTDASTASTDATTDTADASTASADATTDTADATTGSGEGERDPDALREEIAELRAELESFEDDVETRTLHRDDVEGDLKRYVRRRVRRGKARGWGPYLVLLYGTAMTLGAFYTPYLSDGWAIFAMIVIWLSTLGLYVLMVLAGIGFELLSVPGRVRDVIGDWRS